MSDILTTPKITEPDLDEPDVAHIVKKNEVTDAYVFGTPLTALCGARFIPSRDPSGYPVCEPCLKHMRELLVSGNN